MRNLRMQQLMNLEPKMGEIWEISLFPFEKVITRNILNINSLSVRIALFNGGPRFARMSRNSIKFIKKVG